MKSIFQKNKECYLCKTTMNLHLHHIYHSTALRKISDKNGFVCYLCARHHNMSNEGVHFNKSFDLWLKRMCQEVFELTHTRKEFMQLIGRNYDADF